MKRRIRNNDKRGESYFHEKRTWRRKFADAFLGLRQSIHGQSSYRVHLAATAALLLSAAVLGNFDTVRWCLLAICITTVIAAEMFNTAVETLAKAVTDTYNPFVGRALNIASGAVLTVSFGAAVVGVILFGESIWKLFFSAMP